MSGPLVVVVCEQPVKFDIVGLDPDEVIQCTGPARWSEVEDFLKESYKGTWEFSPALVISHPKEGWSNDFIHRFMKQPAESLFVAYGIAKRCSLSECFNSYGECLPAMRTLTEDPKSEELQALGIAVLASQLGWIVIITCDNKQVDTTANSFGPAIHGVQSPLSIQKPYRFRFLIGNVGRGVRLAHSLLSMSAKTLDPAHKIHNRDFMLPESTLVDLQKQWEREEFEGEGAVRSFRSICRVISRSHGSGHQSDKCHEDWELKAFHARQVLLRVVTLCRELATRFFERRACDVTILLGPRESLLNDVDCGDGAIAPFRRVVDFTRSVPSAYFHFGNTNLPGDEIELALARTAMMAVDASSGEIVAVVERKVYPDSDIRPSTKDTDVTIPVEPTVGVREETRYERLCRESDTNRIAIAVLAEGYLEVYHGRQMALWFDRFQWRDFPFRRLSEWLDRYGAFTLSGRNSLLAAVALLMDRKESSIIGFSQRVIGPDVLEPMRDRLGKCGYQVTAECSLTPSTEVLASLLRLDGAHVFVGAKIDCLANQVKVMDGGIGAKGTGRLAAMELANHIESPGFVLKVSSSGELRLYRGQPPSER